MPQASLHITKGDIFMETAVNLKPQDNDHMKDETENLAEKRNGAQM